MRLFVRFFSAIVILPAVAHSGTTVHQLNGSFGSNEHSCTQIAIALGGFDCTFGRNRPAASTFWGGPLFSGAHYNADGIRDQLTYIPTFGSYNIGADTFTPAADDGKVEAPITGTLTIDDNGTAGDPTDDLLSAAFTVGAMVRNLATGQSTRAVQGWSAMNHVMAPTAVNPIETVANGDGGVDYVIGSRGFPDPLCSATNPADCFSTPNASNNVVGDYGIDENLRSFWDVIPAGSIGIERSGLMGEPGFVPVQPIPTTPTGNVGATTTATFDGLTCISNASPSDCDVGPLIWGAGESAGFDNMIMKVSTDSTGAITSAQVYWTEEYRIGFGCASLATCAAFGYDNSWQGGSMTFGTTQYAIDDAATTDQDEAVQIDVLQNDNGLASTVYVGVWTNPLHGTASVSGSPGSPSGIRIAYTPNPGFTGTDSFEYWVETGLAVDYGVVSVTVINADPDGDGVVSSLDNCTLVANPNQCDSDGDGYGNRCDGDLTNNGFTNAQDSVVLRSKLGAPSVAPTYDAADLNCNGFINAQDTVLFRQLLGQPPGPSGLDP